MKRCWGHNSIGLLGGPDRTIRCNFVLYTGRTEEFVAFRYLLCLHVGELHKRKPRDKINMSR